MRVMKTEHNHQFIESGINLNLTTMTLAVQKRYDLFLILLFPTKVIRYAFLNGSKCCLNNLSQCHRFGDWEVRGMNLGSTIDLFTFSLYQLFCGMHSHPFLLHAPILVGGKALC